MIVSHSRRFIFVKTFKTGGTSIEIALSRFCDDRDILAPIEQDDEPLRRAFAGRGPQNCYRPLRPFAPADLPRRLFGGRRRLILQEHAAAWQIRRVVGEEAWRSYFKFTAVRNPFDRLVSRFFHMRSYPTQDRIDEYWDRGSFDQFLRYNAELPNENWKMYTARDEMAVDFAVRFERLEEDLAVVSERIGLDHNLVTELRNISAKSGIRPKGSDYRDVIGPGHRTIIEGLCAKEIEAFGYSFDGGLAAEPRPGERGARLS